MPQVKISPSSTHTAPRLGRCLRLGLDAGLVVGDLDADLLGAGNDVDALAGGNGVGDLGGEGGVVHEEEVDIVDCVVISGSSRMGRTAQSYRC